MQITNLRLKNFRKFKDEKFEFKPGMNVVLGDNETGKSTVLSAILTALYIDPATKSKLLMERLTSWQNATGIEIDLGLRNDIGTEYLLKKDFSGRSSSFKNLQTNKELVDIELINDAIAKLTNIPTATLYRSTALIKQSEMAKIDDINDLQAAAENALSGTGAMNVKEIKSQLKKQINALSIGLNHPAKNPGRIKLLQDEIEELKSKHMEVKAKLEKVIENQSSGKESGNRLIEVNKKIEILEQLMANQQVYEQGTKEMKEIETRLRELEVVIQRAENLVMHQETVEKKLKAFSLWHKGQTDKEGDRINELVGKINAKQSFVESHEKASEKSASGQLVSEERNEIKSGLAKQAFIAGTLIVLGVFGYIFVSIYIGILAIIGAGFALFLLVSSRSATNKKNASVMETQDKLKAVKADLAKDEAELKSVLGKYNVKTKDDFFAQKVRFITLLEQKEKLAAELDGVLNGKDLRSIKEKQIEYLTKKREVQFNKLNDDMRKMQLNPQQYLQKRRELDGLKVERQKLEKAKTESDVRVEESDISTDMLVGIEETLENRESELIQVKEDLKVLEMIDGALDMASNSLADEFGKVVQVNMEQSLPLVTQGRYDKVKINDDFSISVMSKEKGDYLVPENGVLSAGTIDQIYFVYRLALLKSIEGRVSIPLLLDDPFVTFDAKRLEQAKKLLEKEGEKRQIILFTHNKNFENWGNLVKM